MTTIEVGYRVVTPCFCGGAGQQAEFRLPSFKGVLRFWWRALARARCDSLAGVHQMEARLFGSAAGGQSPVRMSLGSHPAAEVRLASQVFGRSSGARYLGYGMNDGGSDRSCLVAPFSAVIRLRCRPSIGSEVPSLVDALTAVGLFGGIGAKSRKGFGSMMLTSLAVDGEETWSSPGSAAELTERITSLVRRQVRLADYPEYTALSEHARFLLFGGPRDPMRLVERIGEEYKAYLRDVGRPDEKRRIGFGLPRHVGRRPEEMNAETHTRRASPLFIHIHECDRRAVAVLSFVPAAFLPGSQNGIRTSRGTVNGDESTLYQPVSDFFARLVGEYPDDAWPVTL